MEGDLEMCEDKMLVATQKLDKVIIKIISIVHMYPGHNSNNHNHHDSKNCHHYNFVH